MFGDRIKKTSKDVICDALRNSLKLTEEELSELLNKPGFPEPDEDGKYDVEQVAKYCASWNLAKTFR